MVLSIRDQLLNVLIDYEYIGSKFTVSMWRDHPGAHSQFKVTETNAKLKIFDQVAAEPESTLNVEEINVAFEELAEQIGGIEQDRDFVFNKMNSNGSWNGESAIIESFRYGAMNPAKWNRIDEGKRRQMAAALNRQDLSEGEKSMYNKFKTARSNWKLSNDC